ncbi:hypothetical protein CBL_04222 [Carabus blaptoides fortunei]
MDGWLLVVRYVRDRVTGNVHGLYWRVPRVMPSGVHEPADRVAVNAAACLKAIIVIFMMFIDASMPCIIAEPSRFSDCTRHGPNERVRCTSLYCMYERDTSIRVFLLTRAALLAMRLFATESSFDIAHVLKARLKK